MATTDGVVQRNGGYSGGQGFNRGGYNNDRGYGGFNDNYGGWLAQSNGGRRNNRRDDGPPAFPTQPPYTAYVGNLPFDKIESDLEELFSGMAISSVRLMRDRDTGSSKGFGYVEFSDDASLREALNANGMDVGGRSMKLMLLREIEGEIVTALAVEALVATTMTHDTAISKEVAAITIVALVVVATIAETGVDPVAASTIFHAN